MCAWQNKELAREQVARFPLPPEAELAQFKATSAPGPTPRTSDMPATEAGGDGEGGGAGGGGRQRVVVDGRGGEEEAKGRIKAAMAAVTRSALRHTQHAAPGR